MKKCFSLIEVTIAILIFTLISGKMFSVFYHGYKLARQSEGKSLAYNLAREKIEELLEDPSVVPTDETRAVVSGFGNIEREVAVANPFLISGLAHIEVTVWWDGGAEQELFETLKADY